MFAPIVDVRQFYHCKQVARLTDGIVCQSGIYHTTYEYGVASLEVFHDILRLQHLAAGNDFSIHL